MNGTSGVGRQCLFQLIRIFQLDGALVARQPDDSAALVRQDGLAFLGVFGLRLALLGGGRVVTIGRR